MSKPQDARILTSSFEIDAHVRCRGRPDSRVRVSADEVDDWERQYGSVEKLIRAPAEHERPNAPTGHICTVDPKGKT